MSAETWWIVGCAVVGAIGLFLVLRGRKGPEVIGGEQPAPIRPAVPRGPNATGLSPLDHHVRQLAADGKKIEAIKAVREHTGLGLREAKDYVEALPDVPPLAKIAPAAPTLQRPDAEAIRQEAAALVAQGQTIEAIKRVREHTGLGLKEAKDYVDALEPPTKANGLHAMFSDAAIEDLANSTVVRGVVERALKNGYAEDRLVAELVRVTGRSDKDMRALIVRIRQGSSSPFG